MKQFKIQYSYPANSDQVAISNWKEKSTTVKAINSKEAVRKFNKSKQDLGTWYILDCYEA